MATPSDPRDLPPPASFGSPRGPVSPVVSRPASPSAATCDYLRDELARAFFDAREQEAYYRMLRRCERPREARRTFHHTFRPVLLRLLALADGDGLAFLEHLITANRRAEQQTPGVNARGSPIQRVRQVEPLGIGILGDDAGRDLEHLRAAYRAAALRCHPDCGGSHDDMVALNRAFEMLHRIFVEDAGAEPIAGGDGESLDSSGETTNALAYLWTVRRLLFGIALDDWALEEAIVYLEQLVPVRAPRPDRAQFPNRPFLIYSAETERIIRTHDLLEQACRLTRLLCAARRADNAARSLAIARKLNRVVREAATRYGVDEDGFPTGPLHPEELEFTPPSLRKAEEYVAGKRKPWIGFETVRQVENAFRLGVIDEKRYHKDLSRLAEKEARLEADRRERLAILAQTRFAPLLPIDAKLKPSQNASRMVPHPDTSYSVSRAEDLTPDQQAVYLRAFASAGDPDLVAQYWLVRLSSVLRSAILFTARCDLAALAQEAEALARLGLANDGCGRAGRSVAHLIRFIAGLDGRRREELVSQVAKRWRRTSTEGGSWVAWKVAEKFGLLPLD